MNTDVLSNFLSWWIPVYHIVDSRNISWIRGLLPRS